MANHESKIITDSVHVLMAFQRNKFNAGKGSKCMRQVIKDYEDDLQILELRCRRAGGEWRIHKTVNARDTQKARLWLLHYLIDHPEASGYIDSLWRTALLQSTNVYGKKKFMLDIDTKEEMKLRTVEEYCYPAEVFMRIETPNGYHFTTEAFDTRRVCELPYVTLIRDGYYFVERVGKCD